MKATVFEKELRPERPVLMLIEDCVDDEVLLRRALGSRLDDVDIRVARTGDDVVKYLIRKEPLAGMGGYKRPDLILLDIALPQVQGIELLQLLRLNDDTRGVPIVIYTGSADESDIEESYRFGANAYVQKPVDFGSLSNILRRIVSFWLFREEH
jgi:two-component system response regulator